MIREHFLLVWDGGREIRFPISLMDTVNSVCLKDGVVVNNTIFYSLFSGLGVLKSLRPMFIYELQEVPTRDLCSVTCEFCDISA